MLLANKQCFSHTKGAIDSGPDALVWLSNIQDGKRLEVAAKCKNLDYLKPELMPLLLLSPADEIQNQNEVLTIASITNGGLTINTVENIVYNHYG